MNISQYHLQIIIYNIIIDINEVYEWLKATCSGEWNICYGTLFYCNSNGEQKLNSRPSIVASFENPDDAMLFRLRWE